MLWLVVTWDDQLPTVLQFTDGGEARESYDRLGDIFEHVYLYVTDDSGRMELILEAERLPPAPL